jgi:hypothetical protein
VKVDPELPCQVFGYWFGPEEHVSVRPVGPPSGAVLPRANSSFSRETELDCLDLVPVQNYWRVLSDLGRYIYRHTSGVLHGERWIFVPVPEALEGRWPVRFRVSYAPSLTWDSLKAWGREAALRARKDAPTVQLHLRRVS